MARHTASVQSLVAELASAGIAIDITTTLEDALDQFLQRGGHQVVVFGPDVGKGLLQHAVRTLRAIDPALHFACFGQSGLPASNVNDIHVITGLHPGSRAGSGALLRFLRHIRPNV